MRTAEGFLLVYDITNYNSYTYLRDIIERIKLTNESNEKICMVVCGNKCDIKNKRIIPYEEGKMLSLENKCSFYETSAKLCINIDDVWNDLIRQVIYKKSMKNRIQKRYTNRCSIL
jgi:GTPase SAR1 family protein